MVFKMLKIDNVKVQTVTFDGLIPGLLDGRFDIVKTNFAGDTPSLYHGLGKGNFEDATFTAGLGLLGSPNGRCGQVFIHPGHEYDVCLAQKLFRFPQFGVIRAEGRAAVAGNIARRFQTQRAITT